MDQEPEKQVRNRRPSCKPATALARRSRREDPDPTEAAISFATEDYSTRETEATLFALAQAVEQRDRQTAGHCERLAFISVAMGMALELNRANLVTLYRGAFLHDVGKVGIPDSILFKPGKLTAAEWVVMRSHVSRGEEICRHLKPLAPVLPIIRHHHERWDGTGYPDGLRQKQIPLLARIVQIADIYDALTSPRPYKPAFPQDLALKTIAEETSRGWRDPEIVHQFFRIHKNIVTKISYFNAGPDTSLLALRNSVSDLETLMAAVA